MAAASIFLDTRRPLKDGSYPIKLRLNNGNTQRLYRTRFSASPQDFEALPTTRKQEHAKLKRALHDLEGKANQILDNLQPFSYTVFELELMGEPSSKKKLDLWGHFDLLLAELVDADRLRYAESVKLAKNSLKKHLDGTYAGASKKTLEAYQRSMVKDGKSLSTIGVYLRNLRVVFNRAIQAGDISQKLYPFGRGGYKIPNTRKKKRAFTKADLKKLYNAKPANDQEALAKDYFFFSYAANGMNLTDMANLQKSQVSTTSFSFVRQKTARSTQDNQEAITVFLTTMSKDILKRRKTKTGDFVFPILTKSMVEADKIKTIKNFNRLINDHLKKLAERNKLDKNISFYYARHSFASMAINSGGSMEQVQEALGHKNIQTTQVYFSGFEDKAKKQLIDKITKF